MRRAVGLEGMVGAGKTTLFRALTNKGAIGVEEYWEYAQKLGIFFPPQPRNVRVSNCYSGSHMFNSCRL